MLENQHTKIVAKIQPFKYMDDLTIITNIIEQCQITTINGQEIQQILRFVQTKLSQLFQTTVDMV